MELKHMPTTPMTQEEMETQCRIVSIAALGDPGEEDEWRVLEQFSQRKGEE